MKTVGVLYGMEKTFPPALVDRINAMNAAGVVAEHVRVGHVAIGMPCRYDVIVDRISHDIPFYRAYLKHAALDGTAVLNNPFWWGADDKFFNYSLAAKLGVAVPPTVILPHKTHPPGTTDQSMRNLEYPIRWHDVFDYVGFPAFLKPISGGGWKNIYKVESPAEFFAAFDDSGPLAMCLQRGVNFTEYYRCYVVGQDKVRAMAYDPRKPHHLRYLRNAAPIEAALHARMVSDCMKLCGALGYDFNSVEFAVEDGVPYAIDFMNPAPDADIHSVGEANFEWVVGAVAEFAIRKAMEPRRLMRDLKWAKFLSGS